MTVWMLEDDERAVGSSDEVADGDLVVRRAGDLLRVGVAQDGGDAPVDWRAEVAIGLLPEHDLPAPSGDGLQRLEDVGDLETALNGVLAAERDRGA